MDKIVFIQHRPLTQAIDKKFHVTELAQRGFEVQYWDVSPYLNPKLKMVDTIESEIITRISTYKEFKNKLRKTDIKKTAFIMNVSLKIGTGKIYNLMHRMGCYKIWLDLFTPPYIQYKKKTYKERVKYIVPLFFSKDIFKAISKVYYRIYARINHMQYECQMSANKSGIWTSAINHPDYDDYITMDSKPIIDDKYICFCDEAFPNHPGLAAILNGIEKPDVETYRNSLNKFFDYVEDKFKMPIVVAAHPVADYDGSEFKGRKIIKYRTGNLIRNSAFTLVHFSNAIVFGVLADVPFCFITTDGLNSIPVFREKLQIMSSFFHKEVYNVDSCKYEDILFSKIEPDIRERCIYDFITTRETEGVKNVDILDKYIHAL